MHTSITRRVRFTAARRLARQGWSAERNESRWGRSARPHGHDFVLDVTVAGPAEPGTGMIIDLKQLKRLLNRVVVEPLDHTELAAAPLLAGRPATGENLVVALWSAIERELEAPIRLEAVTLHEGPLAWYEYRGE